MRIDKHTIISIILLVVTFAFGFVLSMVVAEPEWTCTSCSFDADEITPVVSQEYFENVLREINNAEESVEIIMYSMKAYTSNNSVQQLEDALIAAVARGVDVKVLLDQNEWGGEITSVTKNNWKARDYLEAGGVEVKVESLKQTTHVKLVVVDGKVVVIGSTNWTFSAFERNNEANVLIRDIGTAEYFSNYFKFLWEKY